MNEKFISYNKLYLYLTINLCKIRYGLRVMSYALRVTRNQSNGSINFSILRKVVFCLIFSITSSYLFILIASIATFS